MLDQVVGTLRRLRNSLSGKAEQAYKDRDAAEGSTEEAYADGEAHAYGDASDEVRKAETDEE
jgi:hypothetical protein